MPKMLQLLIIACLSSFCACKAWSAESIPQWGSKVIRVSDGDSITVVDSTGDKARIRLYGIDAPELDQAPHGERARLFVEAALSQQAVAIEGVETDKYGRTVAFVYREGIWRKLFWSKGWPGCMINTACFPFAPGIGKLSARAGKTESAYGPTTTPCRRGNGGNKNAMPGKAADKAITLRNLPLMR